MVANQLQMDGLERVAISQISRVQTPTETHKMVGYSNW